LYGLWDVSQAEWSTRLLELTGLNATLFGEVVPGGTRVGAVSRSGAEASGFTAGTPLCTGAGDQICGLIGMGGSEPGTSTLTLGTGGFLCASSPDPRVDIPALMVQNHVVPDRWLLMAVMLAAASAYQWFRDVFGQVEIDAAEKDGHSAFEHLNDLAGQASPGANGLLFLPYLTSAGSAAAVCSAFRTFPNHGVRAVFLPGEPQGVGRDQGLQLLATQRSFDRQAADRIPGRAGLLVAQVVAVGQCESELALTDIAQENASS
jgi:sugar (pentulose or hexulose) kinase